MGKLNWNRTPQIRLEAKRKHIPWPYKKHKEVLTKCIEIAQTQNLSHELVFLLSIKKQLNKDMYLPPVITKKLWDFHFKHIQTKEIICKSA